MNNKMPRTPFSLPLSGSARETEIRLRNIFSGPKKRPPFLLMVLIAALILLCGNLVAFRSLPVEPVIVMETQYYDSYGNYIEIPALALPAGAENEAVEAINAALNNLRKEYAQLSSRTGTDALENQCLFYPSTTDRYLNLLFFRSRFTTDLNTGHVFSLVYDRKEGTQVSAEDALSLAGLNEKALLDQITELIRPQMERDHQEYGVQLALHNLTLEGFRIKADGQPVFYLTGRMDDVDDEILDAVSGADQLYIWEDRVVTVYNQYGPEPVPLVPADETDQLDPPLWNQWYFAGEEPRGGFVDKSLLEPAYTYVPGENPYGNNFFEVLLEQYTQYQNEWNVFCAREQTDTDQAGDLRVTPTYLGEIPWDGDAYAAAYQICYTFYINGPQGLDWHANFEDIVLSRSAQDGEFTGLLGRMDYEDRMHWMTAREIIQEATHSVSPPDTPTPANPDWENPPAPYDPEVCLYRDGYSTPIGPGNWVDSMFSDFEPEVLVQEGLDVYRTDDYWDEWVVDGGGDAGGVSARRYYDSLEGAWTLNRLETGRTDMVTPRGIRVGATREEVLAAYPGLLSDEKDWTWAYPDDYLWYCANEDGIGPHLYFYFVNDVVYMIQMVDLFN